MKMFTGRLIGFAIMFGICFVGFSAFALFIPLISAFVFWDIAPLSFGWEVTFFIGRLIALVSAMIGLSFTFSKEGDAFAKEYAGE